MPVMDPKVGAKKPKKKKKPFLIRYMEKRRAMAKTKKRQEMMEEAGK